MNRLVILLTFALISLIHHAGWSDQPVEFSRDIRPILSDTCFKCHGPDSEERKADLRLDVREGILGGGGVVQPGNLDESDLFQRITSDDPDVLMPPPDSGRKLTEQQKQLFRKWIEQGANYQRHWSFEPPASPELPTVKNESWCQNEIDRFIAARQDSLNMSPSPPAGRNTLIRRVALDLTGLPPTDELAERYLTSASDNWYEELVDELLASEHYGEHLARFWLDVARYGDTHGLHLDNYRENWLYRDWIIDAFNDNMPFDQFATEQLAGDLLESPTDSQLIATGFNRSHVTTNEGGSIPEEVYVRNVVDRVSTTGTVFLGLTVGCAQCHDHKFDPISQRNFYELFAFFNCLDGDPMDGNLKDPAPVLRFMHDDEKQQLATMDSQIKELGEAIENRIAQFEYEEPDPETIRVELEEPAEFTWVNDAIPGGGTEEGTWKFIKAEEGPVRTEPTSRSQTSDGLVQHVFKQATVPLRVDAADVLFAYVFLDPENPPQEIMLQFHTGMWEHRAYWGDNKIDWGSDETASRRRLGSLPETGQWIRLEVPAATVGLENGAAVDGMAFTQYGGRAFWDDAGVVSKRNQFVELNSLAAWTKIQIEAKGRGLPEPIKKILEKPQSEWEASQANTVREYFLKNVYPESTRLIAADTNKEKELAAKRDEYVNQFPTTLIWKEKAEPTPAYVLRRGEYDQRGEQVERAVLTELADWPENAPRNRLGLAEWLLAPDNPLTARVTVNRFWQQVFGKGLVKTTEDFGAQGIGPTHPELLDWLATDFVKNHWNVRRLIKMMVMSSTYRQSSKVSPKLLALDPENKWLARGPRYRLDAEVLRDQALAVSGLLVPTVGGPSVKPPQPDGLWFVVGYTDSNTVRFKKDDGNEKVHRRSMYTFWKRTAPPPQMNIFDAPSRESCTVRRERTNTPLQALVLMNETQYVEAARNLAQRVLDSTAQSDSDRIRQLFQWALFRQPNDQTINVVQQTLDANRAEYQSDIESAKKLISIGETPAEEKYDAIELASWTMIANLIMNTDEFICKN